MIGIKPFASGNLFASRGTPDSPTKRDDDQRARLALRYVLCSDVLSASIPGLITVDQVKNAAAAVKERREFDKAEAMLYQKLTASMWRAAARLRRLRRWEWV
jgi:aryl-alcohol dehydrogenase-like predicted oxidoreductase